MGLGWVFPPYTNHPEMQLCGKGFRRVGVQASMTPGISCGNSGFLVQGFLGRSTNVRFMVFGNQSLGFKAATGYRSTSST